MTVVQPGWVPRGTRPLFQDQNAHSAEHNDHDGEGNQVPPDPTWTYEHDLTAEDMLVHLLGRDRATLRVAKRAALRWMMACLLWRKRHQL